MGKAEGSSTEGELHARQSHGARSLLYDVRSGSWGGFRVGRGRAKMSYLTRICRKKCSQSSICILLLALLLLATGHSSALRSQEPAKGPETAPATLPAETPAAPPLDGREGRQLLLESFRPQPMLRVKQTLLKHASVPAIDIHTHLRFKIKQTAQQLDDWVATMDRENIALAVSLDATLGPTLDEHLAFLKPHSDRFVVFAHIDWKGPGGKDDDPASWDCQREDFAKRVARDLKAAKEQGIAGLKIFKDFGLTYKGPDGKHLKIDDPRWDEIWSTCGQLGLPVIMHVADPAAFFQPIDEKNERWEELSRHKDWSFYGPEHPKREDLLAAMLRVIEKHRQTTFIGAHVASNSEDLTTVSQWLDKHPNLYVEIASRISELGRQPFTARKFFVRYQDRILLGTDGPWPEERLHAYWRFLETDDEYFSYSEKPFPPQGLWQIYGVSLPQEVLKKIYADNALKLIPAARDKYAKQAERLLKLHPPVAIPPVVVPPPMATPPAVPATPPVVPAASAPATPGPATPGPASPAPIAPVKPAPAAAAPAVPAAGSK